MTDTTSARELLIVALQDLCGAERAWGERADALRAGEPGRSLTRFLEEDLKRSAAQAEALAELAKALDAEPEGSPNIWLNAILDDAERDIATIAQGPLRDTALIGAFRKAKQAERVSYKTALALAHRLDLEDAAALFCRHRDQEMAADDRLATLLAVAAEMVD